MGRLIKIQEIDQFFDVVKVQEGAVTAAVLDGVKQLDERQELEPMIRDILWDPTDTPHGPTEIADILTSKIRLRGNKCLCAIILKGKSFPKIRSKDIAHQVLRLRQISDLSLIVLLAVGHIQDSAQRDFIQVAFDANYDYIIIDAIDCARLLIAYEKICPQDGRRFSDDGICLHGHEQSVGVEIKIRAKEELHYEVAEIRDVSHAGARRLTAKILVSNYEREALREVIRNATKQIIQSKYHRNNLVAKHWGNTNAHVVCLFLASDLQDLRNLNWLARTQWIDPNLSSAMRPMKFESTEIVDDITVIWSESYYMMRNFYGQNTVDKGKFLDRLEPLVKQACSLGEKLCSWFDAFEEGKINESVLIKQVRNISTEIETIVIKSGDLPFPPQDALDYDSRAHSLFSWLSNMVIYYSHPGEEMWPTKNRTLLMKLTVRDFRADVQRLAFEREKLH